MTPPRSACPPAEDIETTSADALADIPVVFLESLQALDGAKRIGLRADARVACLSPAVATAGDQPVRVLDAKLSGRAERGLFAFIDDMSAFGLTLARTLPANPASPMAAAIAARHSTLFCGQILLKAAMLEDADYREPRAIVLSTTPGSDGDYAAGWTWPTLLAGNPSLRVLRQPVELAEVGEAVGPFLDRLRLSPQARLVATVRRLSRFLPAALSRGTAYIVNDNELIRETVLALIARGFRPEWIDPPAVERSPRDPDRHEPVLDAAEELFIPFAERWLCAEALSPVVALYRQDLLDALQHELDVHRAWKRTLSDLGGHAKPRTILLNFPKGDYGPGLLMAAREHGIPVCSFRHGVTHEFGALSHVDHGTMESASSDLVFCYNEAGAAVQRGVPHAVGRAFAVGMPSDYFGTGSYRQPRGDAAPIAYISTNLYCGYRVFPTAGINDVERMQPERVLLNDVFSRLPHRVLYKNYPAQTYVDGDPVIAEAERCANVEVFSKKLNASYLFADSRILVTARASSTVGHCLVSGKPVVFINIPDHLPVRAEAIPLFEAGLFFFDFADPQMPERLRTFLSQPLEQIEAAWNERAAARERLIERLFSSAQGGAGRRISEILIDALDTTETAAKPLQTSP